MPRAEFHNEAVIRVDFERRIARESLPHRVVKRKLARCDAACESAALELDLRVERAVATVARTRRNARGREYVARLLEQPRLALGKCARLVLGRSHQRVGRRHQVHAELQPAVLRDARRDAGVVAGAAQQRGDRLDVGAGTLRVRADDDARVGLRAREVRIHARTVVADHGADHARELRGEDRVAVEAVLHVDDRRIGRRGE